MMKTRRSRQTAELRAALAACQERASVLAHERDRALQRLAQLTEGSAAAEATGLRTVGLTA